MLRWIKRLFAAFSLFLAMATIVIWTWVAFEGPQRFAWQGSREYSLTFNNYTYRFTILRGEQVTGELRGHLLIIPAGTETAFPMRGTLHFISDRHGHAFFGQFVSSWPAENPTLVLPAPVPLPGGGTLMTRRYARGVDFGIPYWFVTLLALFLPVSMAINATRRLMRQRGQPTNVHLCRHCHYDLRASADRCPECGNLIPQPSTS